MATIISQGGCDAANTSTPAPLVILSRFFLPFHLSWPPNIGQSCRICSWRWYTVCRGLAVRCSCVVDPYNIMMCIVGWAGCSLVLVLFLSTVSSRHPEGEVGRYCPKRQCHMHILEGQRLLTYAWSPSIHWLRQSSLPFPQGYDSNAENSEGARLARVVWRAREWGCFVVLEQFLSALYRQPATIYMLTSRGTDAHRVTASDGFQIPPPTLNMLTCRCYCGRQPVSWVLQTFPSQNMAGRSKTR